MRIIVIAVVVALCACAPRGALTLYPEAKHVGSVESVIVATSRRRVQGPPYFDGERSRTTNFAVMSVSIPPKRELGSISYVKQGAKPDPKTDFLLTDATNLSGTPGFIQEINAALATDPNHSREGTLFVHGFNTNFAEGLYRSAQFQHDTARNGVSVFFSWPSQARMLDYLADQESALYSRDAMATTLTAMARSNIGSINLIGHSMGTLLLMDTLRTMAMTGNDAFFRKLNAVVLISADLDVDLFRQEAMPVVARGVDIYVVTSGGDRALKLSAMMRGNDKRLGLLGDPSQLDPVKVTMIDISQISAADATAHFKLATSPALLAFLRAVQASGVDVLEAHRPGLIASSVALVQSGVNVILEPLQ